MQFEFQQRVMMLKHIQIQINSNHVPPDHNLEVLSTLEKKENLFKQKIHILTQQIQTLGIHFPYLFQKYQITKIMLMKL